MLTFLLYLLTCCLGFVIGAALTGFFLLEVDTVDFSKFTAALTQLSSDIQLLIAQNANAQPTIDAATAQLVAADVAVQAALTPAPPAPAPSSAPVATEAPAADASQLPPHQR